MAPRVFRSLFTICILLGAGRLSAQIKWEQTNGPFGGSVFYLFITRTNTIYANTRDGWYISNDHSTWTHEVSQQFPFGTIGPPIAQAPDGTMFASFMGRTSGIAYSDDGGMRWDTAVGSTAEEILNVQYHPFYAWDGDSLRQSTDDGRTWVTIPHKRFMSFRSASNTFFSYGQGTEIAQTDSLGHFLGYLWQDGITTRSSDTGETWTSVLPGNCSLMLQRDSELFAYVSFGLGADSAFVFRSSDDGNSWQSFARLDSVGLLAQANDGALYCLKMWQNGRSSSGGTAEAGYVQRSLDNGRTWDSIGGVLPSGSVLYAFSVDSSGELYLGLDTGFAYLEDGTWKIANSGLVLSQVLGIENDLDGNLYVNSTTGFWFSQDGENWNRIEVPSNAGNQFPIFKDRYFVQDTAGITYRTTDLGQSWATTSLKAIEIVPISEDTLIAIDTLSLYESTDGGLTWNQKHYFNRFIGDVAIKDRILYVNAGLIHPYFQPKFFQSTDFGSNWEPSDGFGFALTSAGDSLTLRYYFSIIRTADSGKHWRSLGGGDAIRVDSNGNFFVSDHGSNDGVLMSTDSGSSWAYCSDGLQSGQVTGIAFGPQGRLYAALFNHGVWKTKTQSELDVRTSGPPLNQELLEISVIGGRKFVLVQLPSVGRIELSLYDERGVKVRTFLDCNPENSNLVFELPTDLVGAYWLELVTTDRTFVKGVFLP